jgi:hypothetical protein
MAETRTFYIAENENLFNFLDRAQINFASPKWKELAFISAKKSNNQIGYFQFKDGDSFIKFFIIPKIHEASKTKEKDFFAYLSRFYELKNKYSGVNSATVEGNILDLSFDDFNKAKSETIEDYIKNKYVFALKTLDKFFRKHSTTRIKKSGYSAQSVSNKLDLSRNIRELDKTNVHQIRREKELFSEIAQISEQVLKQFKFEKVKHFISAKDEIIQLSNGVINQIKKRYKSELTFNFKDRQIISNRIRKLFKGKKELQEVYNALLILIGLEHFQSEASSKEILKLENMLALFFNPADLYEWIVYDDFKTKNPDSVIHKDKLGYGTSKNYSLLESGVEVQKFDSRPDLIVESESDVIIIDAKWKILKRLSELSFSDIAKLGRDHAIRKKDFEGKSIRNILVYPKVGFGSATRLSLDYDPEFVFEVMEIEA